MKLRTLELEKFGLFDHLRLRFRDDARVHVVYGPNEAGKSTALAAVGALLYGVPERTPHAFRFPSGEMRVGAEIVGRDGASLVVRRRKGRKNTLQNEDGAPLPDDTLDALLGGVGEDVFHRSFGLNSASLRDGGRAMLGADGDVGAALLEAASGLRGLIGVRKSIDEEAGLIFAERRSEKKLFYQALDRHGDAVKAIRAKELGTDAWRRLNDDIERFGAEIEAIRRARRDAEVERARLARLRRAAPVLQEIAVLTSGLEARAGLPRFAPGQAEIVELRPPRARRGERGRRPRRRGCRASPRGGAEHRLRSEGARRRARDRDAVSEERRLRQREARPAARPGRGDGLRRCACRRGARARARRRGCARSRPADRGRDGGPARASQGGTRNRGAGRRAGPPAGQGEERGRGDARRARRAAGRLRSDRGARGLWRSWQGRRARPRT